MQISTIGIELAKTVFQIHADSASGGRRPQRPLRPFHRCLEDVSARGQWHVVQDLRENRPVRSICLSCGELIEGASCDRAEAIGVEVIERDADNPAARDKPGTRQVEQTRQQLASREVPRGAHEDDDLRIFWINPCWNLCQSTCPLPRPPRPEGQTLPILRACPINPPTCHWIPFRVVADKRETAPFARRKE
jgi:hypothetical protein